MKCWPPCCAAMLSEDRAVLPPKYTQFLSPLPPSQVPATMTPFLNNCRMLGFLASLLVCMQPALYLVARALSRHLTAHAFKCLPRASSMNLQPFSPGLRAFRGLTLGNPSNIISDHCPLSLCSSLTGLLISGVVPVPRLPQGIILPEYPGISFCLEHSPGSVCDCLFLSFQAFPSITTP